MRELSAVLPGIDEVVHLAQKFPRNADDLVWIAGLENDGPWVVLSLDRLKKQGGAEREALRRAGHTVFLLERQWLDQTFWAQAERMVRWWPQIVAQAAMVEGGAFVVPWHHTSKAKFRAVKL